MKKLTITLENLFYFAYIIALVSWMFSNVMYISNICNILLKLSYCMLIVLFFLRIDKSPKKEFLISVLVLFFTFISWRIANNPTIFILFLFIINSRSIHLKKFVLFDCKLKTFFLLLIVGLYFLGFTNNYIMYRDSGIIRSSMGFSHPNIFGAFVFSIYCEYLYINHQKLRTIFLIFLSLLVTFIISYFSDSRGSYLSVILLCGMVLFYRFPIFKVFDNKLVKTAINYSFVIFALFSVFLSLKYVPTSNFFLKLDSILSGRIKFGNMFLNDYSIKLLGNRLHLVGTYEAHLTGQRSLILDNSYIKLILQYGVIPFLIFMISYIKTSKIMYNKSDYVFVIIFFIYAIRGLTENILFGLYGNIFLLYLSKTFFKEEVKQDDVEIQKKSIELC